MTRSSWASGLYGRTALGFIALIAVVLMIQGGVFVWLVNRADEANTEDQVARLELTRTLSATLSAELQRSPQLDLGERLAELDHGAHLFAILRNGDVVGVRPSQNVIDGVVEQFRRRSEYDPIPASWERGRYTGSPLIVDGRLVGVLGAIPLTAFERFGLAAVAFGVGLLIVGTLVTSTVIAGPVRSRLRDLREAAMRLGQGDSAARATEEGSDEVAELAFAFNRMADELGHRTNALETSDRLRRQLIADVSHELMTPLTAVLGHLETLTMDEVRLNDAQRLKQIEITAREARRLERLIGDLLAAARLEDRGIELNIEPIETRELFEQLAARHEYDCRRRAIALRVRVEPGADAFDADPFRIDQVLENLMTNALRHTPDGGTIELSAAPTAAGIALEISDSGEGIPSEHLPYIFDRFYKAASAHGIASRGSGLGLSIVKAIVERHGGRVTAASTAGSGTSIRIEIPAPAVTAG
jgi:signal transduction histidine kinase